MSTVALALKSAAAGLIASEIAIDGWLDRVKQPTPHELALIKARAAATSEQTAKQVLGVNRWIHGLSYPDALERLTDHPTANVRQLLVWKC